MSRRPDHAAGNPGAGVAGGLGGKIVRLSVDDHGASDDLRDGEPVCQDAHAGLAAAPKEGRQIPRVIGVGAVGRIQMSAGVLKIRRGAGGTVVDMKPEDPGGAGGVLIPGVISSWCPMPSVWAVTCRFASGTGTRGSASPFPA